MFVVRKPNIKHPIFGNRGAERATPEELRAVNQGMHHDTHSHQEPLLVAGIGGSAGSIEAFRAILERLRTDTDIAFVFALHLAPNKDSRLADILQRSTTMPVVEAEDGIPVEANHVYVITPDSDLFVQQGMIRAKHPRTMTQRHHQADLLLISIAHDYGPRAVAVVLSGSDGDGAEGLAAVKFQGGRTFVQKLSSARIPSMPKNALATGCVDEELAPAKIAEELNALGRGNQSHRVENAG
jgi:two-component system CheB/CheR fusion protein